MQFSMQTVLGLVTILAFSGVVLSCPEGHGCFRSPKECGDTGAVMCDLFVSWKESLAGDALDFTLRTKESNGTLPRWVAVGFSLDGKMKDDDILMCRQTDAGAVVLEHYWSTMNTPGQPAIVKETSANPTADGLSNMRRTYEDGFVGCTFTRAMSVPGKEHIYDLSETTVPDMMPKYHLFFGSGPVIQDVPVRHEVDPFHTEAGVNLTVTGEVMVEMGHDSHEDDAAFITYSTVLTLIMTSLSVAFN